MNSDGSNPLIAESLGSESHLTRSLKLEDRDKEAKREMEGSKEKERYREKYMAKSIQELDLSSCQQCTPSYRLLPEDVRNFVLYAVFCAEIHYLFCSELKLSGVCRSAVPNTFSKSEIRAWCTSFE